MVAMFLHGKSNSQKVRCSYLSIHIKGWYVLYSLCKTDYHYFYWHVHMCSQFFKVLILNSAACMIFYCALPGIDFIELLDFVMSYQQLRNLEFSLLQPNLNPMRLYNLPWELWNFASSRYEWRFVNIILLLLPWLSLCAVNSQLFLIFFFSVQHVLGF